MKKKFLFGLLILTACNEPAGKKAGEELKKLSAIITTANWRVNGDTDTSYIYFSQQADYTCKTYQFKLIKGDSSVIKQGSISISGDSVIWNWYNKSLVLENIIDNKVNWKEKKSGENYLLENKNDSLLQMNLEDRQLMFKRTLPLSTFLVRAKYDYEHGSNLLDSAEVKPRKLIRH
jgi:hypothetical protein